MANILNTTQIFVGADVVTHTNLNNIISGSSFVAGVGGATDDTTLEVDSTGGFLQVKEIDTAQIKNDSITTSKILDSNVTKAKLEDMTNLTVLGNTSGATSAPQEVDIIDDDTMATATDESLATSESIKAYVDSVATFDPNPYAGDESVTFPNGLIMKWGKSAPIPIDSSDTINLTTAFPTAVLNIQLTKNAGQQNTGGGELTVDSIFTDSFVIRNGLDVTGPVFWFAIGY
jgi:hypothetical protein